MEGEVPKDTTEKCGTRISFHSQPHHLHFDHSMSQHQMPESPRQPGDPINAVHTVETGPMALRPKLSHGLPFAGIKLIGENDTSLHRAPQRQAKR